LARGDVVTGLYSVAASGYVTYQPVAGVEVLIKSVFGSIPEDVRMEIYDGTLAAIVLQSFTQFESGTDPRDLVHAGKLNVFITNSIYLKLLNLNATYAQTLGFSGIQTK